MRFSLLLCLFSITGSTATWAMEDGEPAPKAAPIAPMRVYFAPLTASDDAKSSVGLIEERLLVASRRHTRFAVLGAADMRRMLDADAVRQAMDCDADSCMGEIADGVGAPQIISGQLGRIGDRWTLTLSRINRGDMRPLSRVLRESKGSTPEGLLSQLDGMMAETLGEAPSAQLESGPSPLVIAGGVGLGAGALLAVGGAVALGLSWSHFNSKVNDGKIAPADEAEFRSTGRAYDLAVTGLFGAGAVAGAVGLGLLVVGLASE